MPATHRARGKEDKQQRRAQILQTARTVWDRCTYSTFTMAEVASAAGLAKGTLYLYFATKEELLLSILEAELNSWFDALDAGLVADGNWDTERAAALICHTVEQQPALTRLLPIAASILEHNISPTRARAYKERLLSRSTVSGALLEQRLGFLTRSKGIWLLLQIHALVVGLGQMAAPAPVVAQVLTDPAMASLRVEFGSAFTSTITTLLHGLRSEAADH